jgi:hypothetical protein
MLLFLPNLSSNLGNFTPFTKSWIFLHEVAVYLFKNMGDETVISV